MTALTQNEVREHLSKAIADLEACANGPSGRDTVLAWDNYLGVKFIDGKASAIEITQATSLEGVSLSKLPEVTNGRSEKAKLTKRRDVALRQADHLRLILSENFPASAI